MPGVGPYHHHRIGRPRLSYSTVSSPPPVVLLRCVTRHVSLVGPPSLVRASVTEVCVPSGRVSSPRRPKPSYARSVTSWFGSVTLVITPSPASYSISVLCPAAFTWLFGKM